MLKKKLLPEPEPRMVAVNDSGEPIDRSSALEEANIAFDPTNQTLDLTKAEKRRTTALMMAIQAYSNLIIKDAEYLKEMHNEARREGGPVIKPATMHAMVEAAIQFDAFIAGRFSVEPAETPADAPAEQPAETVNA